MLDAIITDIVLSSRALAVLIGAAVMIDGIFLVAFKNDHGIATNHTLSDLGWVLCCMGIAGAAVNFILNEMLTVGAMNTLSARLGVLWIWFWIATGLSLRLASRSKRPKVIVFVCGCWIVSGSLLANLAGV